MMPASRSPGAATREEAVMAIRPAVLEAVRRRPVASFLLLTFLPAWALWLGSGAVSRAGSYMLDPSWVLAQLGVFAPALAGFAVAALTRTGAARTGARLVALLYVPALVLASAIATRGFDDLRRVEGAGLGLTSVLAIAALVLLGRRGSRVEPWPLREARAGAIALWASGAALLPLAVYAAGWAVSGGTSVPSPFPFPVPNRELTASAALLALGWNLVFGGSLGEEPGWRGFLLPRLLADRSPFGASLVVGFWWALWHAPLDWVQGFVAEGPGALLARQAWALPLAVLFTWATVRAGGSLLPAIAAHTALNAVPDFALADPPRYAAATALFWVASLAAAVAVVTLDPVMLRVPAPSQAAEAGPPP
jgi:membrane protease YdiL (CAAX protease family)